MQHIDVNGVWQLGRPNDEHEQEHEDISLPQEHVNVLEAMKCLRVLVHVRR